MPDYNIKNYPYNLIKRICGTKDINFEITPVTEYQLNLEIKTLPDEYADVLVKRFINKMKLDEIASEKGITKQAVAEKIDAAIEKLSAPAASARIFSPDYTALKKYETEMLFRLEMKENSLLRQSVQIEQDYKDKYDRLKELEKDLNKLIKYVNMQHDLTVETKENLRRIRRDLRTVTFSDPGAFNSKSNLLSTRTTNYLHRQGLHSLESVAVLLQYDVTAARNWSKKVREETFAAIKELYNIDHGLEYDEAISKKKQNAVSKTASAFSA